MPDTESGVILSRMSCEDIPAVHRLECACFGSNAWSAASFDEVLSNPYALFYVARSGGCIIGYIGAYRLYTEIEIMNLAVLPEMRCKGIASALLRELLSVGEQAAPERAYLEVRHSNFAAVSLYERFGFRITGIRENYYSNPCEDALLMTLDFLQRQ